HLSVIRTFTNHFTSHPQFPSFFTCFAPHRHLHSFPTRRSSDLTSSAATAVPSASISTLPALVRAAPVTRAPRRSVTPSRSASARSEEHTSELQSHLNLVCRLLLDKKTTI